MNTDPHWAVYVPRYVAEDLIAHPDDSPVARVQRLTSVVLFADISGFTTLSETLARAGQAGTEELTLLLNSYFDPMVSLIQSYGGMAVKFAGDALTVLFHCHGMRDLTVRRAVRCALAMQARMPAYANITTSAGPFSLTIRIGLAFGPVICTNVGDPAIRLEYVLMGHTITQSAQAEQHARSGEIVLHTNLLPSLGVTAETVPTSDPAHFVRLVDYHEYVARCDPPPLPAHVPSAVRGMLEAFLPPAIALRLSRGQRELINEHRRVVVLFVQFADFDYDDDPQIGATIQRYLSEVIWIVGRYDGYLRQVEMGDKGSKYIVLFGVPVAHENDAERALRCALELQQVQQIETRIGISTGYAYCGLIGSATRQEYTVAGDEINVAARLMQAAQPGQILVSSIVQVMATSRFNWQTLGPIRVKGKTLPIRVFALLGWQQRPMQQAAKLLTSQALIGRMPELAHATECITLALGGRGQVIGITGDAGVGKSRLAAEIFQMAEQRGMHGYGGACLSYATTVSYQVWQEILREALALDAAHDIERQVAHIYTVFTTLGVPQPQRIPLLSTILGVSISDTELTRSLDGRLRHAGLHALLRDWLRQQSRTVPLLLLLEDCHWIDPLSRELLETLARVIVDLPVLIVVVYRAPEKTGVYPRVAPLRHFRELRLNELNTAESEELVQAFADRFAPDMVRRILEQAQGNPFYIHALFDLLQHNAQNGTPTAAEQTTPSTVLPDLPATLQSLLMSRIDQLQERPKTTLKVASVIGRSFFAPWLCHVYPQLGTPDQVDEYLDQLTRLDLTIPGRTTPEPEYLFKHVLLQEAAYASLAVAARAQLHEQIGQHIEARYATELDRWLDVLAYHYGQSNNIERQRYYFRRAAEAARAIYAHQRAIDYYRRLLLLLEPAEQIDVLLELGTIYQIVGEWNTAETCFDRALAQAYIHDNLMAQARCAYAHGYLDYLHGTYGEAQVWLEEARQQFADLDDQHGVASALLALGNVAEQQDEYEQALEYYQACRATALTLGDDYQASHALALMGHIYRYNGDYARTLEYYEQWLYKASEHGDREQVGTMLGHLGRVYWLMGNAEGAMFCYQQRLRTAMEIGDLPMLNEACGNMAEIYGYQGCHAEAAACLSRSLHISVELGSRAGVMTALGYLATIFTFQARYAEAEQLFARAITLGKALGMLSYVAEFRYYQALLYYEQACYTAAWESNTEAMHLAQQVEYHEGLFRGQVLAVRIRVAQGQIDREAATAALREMLHRWREPMHLATLHHEIWQLDHDRQTHRRVAVNLYRSIPDRALRAEYRRRYYDLTGEQRTGYVPPPVPDVITHDPVQLDLLLEQVDHTIALLVA